MTRDKISHLYVVKWLNREQSVNSTKIKPNNTNYYFCKHEYGETYMYTKEKRIDLCFLTLTSRYTI